MYIADLHIHSRYSRATSRDLTPENLDFQARRKGIRVLGTGDFTHPAWRQELKEKLVLEEDGLYRLKKEYVRNPEKGAEEDRTRFVITGEISSIYKQDGKVRKVHSLLILPGLEEAERLSVKLETIGNIHSDGRPILGLSCHESSGNYAGYLSGGNLCSSAYLDSAFSCSGLPGLQSTTALGS